MVAVLPATSVDCERGFSGLGRIKTYARSSLSDLHLEALLRISSSKMDIVAFSEHREVLVATWKNMKVRRTTDREDRLQD
jgi:hypothetical protein